MASNRELEQKAAELEARLAELTAQSNAAEERAKVAEAKAAEAKPRTYSGITCKVSENAKVLSIYGMQSRPVSLYASQFVKLFDHATEIKAFILANADTLAWKTPDEKREALARIAAPIVETATPTA